MRTNHCSSSPDLFARLSPLWPSTRSPTSLYLWFEMSRLSSPFCCLSISQSTAKQDGQNNKSFALYNAKPYTCRHIQYASSIMLFIRDFIFFFHFWFWFRFFFLVRLLCEVCGMILFFCISQKVSKIHKNPCHRTSLEGWLWFDSHALQGGELFGHEGLLGSSSFILFYFLFFFLDCLDSFPFFQYPGFRF